MLHNLGELDDWLKVKKRKVTLEEEELDVDQNNKKAGTKKRRRFYLHETPAELQSPLFLQGIETPPASSFLHAVELRLVQLDSSFKYRPHHPEKDSQLLGFISSSRLPVVGPFHLYSPSGRVETRVTCVSEVSLSSSQAELCLDFHQYIFSEVLRLTDSMQFQGGGLVLVPLNKTKELDLQFLATFRDPDRKLCIERWSQFVVCPTYKESKEHYFIEELIPGLAVTDQMPSSKETFRDYYRRQYGLEVEELEEPLLRISSADRRPDMLRPSPGDKQQTKQGPGNTLFLPQLMGVARVGAGLWRQAQMFPFVLHRVSSLLQARSLLARLCHRTEDDLQEPSTVLSPVLPEFEQLIDPSRVGEFASPWQVLEGLTLRAAGDTMDMERLEMLGDVFLKISTSVFLYYKSLEPGVEEYRLKDEGYLTLLRSRVVSNKNLLRLGHEVSLQKAVVSCRLQPHLTWLPPGYCRLQLDQRLVELDSKFGQYVQDSRKKSRLSTGSMLSWLKEEELPGLQDLTDSDILTETARRLHSEDTGGVSLRNFVLLSDKSVADCVEALIGTFLVHSGQIETLR